MRHGTTNIKFLYIFSKNTQISNFMKIPLVGDELFRADRRTDIKTDMTKLTVNFANAPDKDIRNMLSDDPNDDKYK